MAAFGVHGIEQLGDVDAAYSDPMVAVGGLINAEGGLDESNSTARLALRFRSVGGTTRRLDNPELVQLYVRHLYSRMRVA